MHFCVQVHVFTPLHMLSIPIPINKFDTLLFYFSSFWFLGSCLSVFDIYCSSISRLHVGNEAIPFSSFYRNEIQYIIFIYLILLQISLLRKSLLGVWAPSEFHRGEKQYFIVFNECDPCFTLPFCKLHFSIVLNQSSPSSVSSQPSQRRQKLNFEFMSLCIIVAHA